MIAPVSIVSGSRSDGSHPVTAVACRDPLPGPWRRGYYSGPIRSLVWLALTLVFSVYGAAKLTTSLPLVIAFLRARR